MKAATTGLVLLVAGLASLIIAVPVADQTAQSEGCPLPQGAGVVQVKKKELDKHCDIRLILLLTRDIQSNIDISNRVGT
ncbi:hypothetical protein ElyMa_004716400 [Elysia marginata]|uniref:Uncharacterized protein n=1 Tax=Elysia marginata TaxID=1093978 RepID=A0AAV4I8Z8_9GAST|nr:hypothetical protein ElyMa_004716400 [Elysia marginata]